MAPLNKRYHCVYYLITFEIILLFSQDSSTFLTGHTLKQILMSGAFFSDTPPRIVRISIKWMSFHIINPRVYYKLDLCSNLLVISPVMLPITITILTFILLVRCYHLDSANANIFAPLIQGTHFPWQLLLLLFPVHKRQLLQSFERIFVIP